jgi:ribosomal protein S18 acetylase RimI-like enzyme
VPEVILRPAEAADGGVIARIQLAAWRATYGHLNPAMVDGLDLERTTENWARAAVDATHRLRLAEYDGTRVGYAFSGSADGEADGVGELDAVYLLPSAQGLGVGRLLVEDALTGLADAGYAECVLWVADQNTHARGFYQHLGFRPDTGRDIWRGLPVVRYRRLLPVASA